MEQYTAEEVADLVDDSDIDHESESDIEEDPAFPLPTLDSDDDAAVAATPATSPATYLSPSPPRLGAGGITCVYIDAIKITYMYLHMYIYYR